jgi:O-antigen/teichoic acid export membrane protein
LVFATSAQRFVPEYAKRGALDLLARLPVRSRWLAVASASVIAAVGILAVNFWRLTCRLPRPAALDCRLRPCRSTPDADAGRHRAFVQLDPRGAAAAIRVRHLVMLTIVSAAYLLNFPATAETAVTAVAAALMLTVIGQTFVLNRRLAHAVPPGPKTYEVKTWLSISLPTLIVEGFYLLLTHVDIILLQHFRSPDDVAVYYAAAKTLMLISFVHFAVSAAVGHRFSEYHVTKDHNRLKDILTDSIRWTFWASLAASIVILAMGRPLLSLFGLHFIDGFNLMLILVVGLMARASVGPAERLLNMLGEQRACAAVYATAFVLNMVLCIVLIPRLGVDGAAVATSTALIVESILLFLVTKHRLGFHVFIWGRS